MGVSTPKMERSCGLKPTYACVFIVHNLKVVASELLHPFVVLFEKLIVHIPTGANRASINDKVIGE
jgi:hypothetical protein